MGASKEVTGANGAPRGAMDNSGAAMINTDGAPKEATEIITKVMEVTEEANMAETDMEPQLEARPPEGALEVVGASKAEGVGVDPNVVDPKEEDVTIPIRYV